MRQLAFALLALSFAGCSSWIHSFKNSITGDEQVDVPENTSQFTTPAARGPASITAYDNRSGTAPAPLQAQPTGPDLSASEFAPLARLSDDSAARGYRRQASPWDGTGPANEGSLWNSDSQDGYLFTKNLLYKIGDIIVVKVEPEINNTLNFEIASLLGRTTVQQVAADEAGRKIASVAAQKTEKALGSAALGNAVGQAAAQATVNALDANTRYVDISDIPVRITETLARNSYKVEGARRVYIRNAPYQVKISGVVRDEDIGPTRMIASSRIFESKMELTK